MWFPYIKAWKPKQPRGTCILLFSCMHTYEPSLIFRELPEMSPNISSKTYYFLPKFRNLPHLNKEFSYIFYTFLINLPEIKGKTPCWVFETYHMCAYASCNSVVLYWWLLWNQIKTGWKLFNKQHIILVLIDSTPFYWSIVEFRLGLVKQSPVFTLPNKCVWNNLEGL